MKKIGLVGGTGPESTLMYYRELNTRIDRMTGGKEMPDIAIESVNFRRAWEYVEKGQYDLLADYLAEKIQSLAAGGAKVISLTAGTMHVVMDELLGKTKTDLVSIPQAVCREAQRRGYRKVGLLGTIFTMEKEYMKTDFRKAGIEVVIPEKADRELVARRILEELENGIVKESTLKEFQEIIRKMKEQEGIEAVVLGCTELPMILNEGNSPVAVLDSVEIHIQELIKISIEDGNQ
ncbi:MAG: amino acid racemase [Clostridia bacterium]|nr:amino acid racemase [Clostridia bacterium]